MTDLKEFNRAKPLIRSIVAFLVYLRFGGEIEVAATYAKTDEFLSQLKKDIESQTK